MKKQQKSGKDILLYGRHPVEMALKNKRRHILEIYAIKGDTLPAISAQIPVRSVNKEYLDNLVGRESLHQGIAADRRFDTPLGQNRSSRCHDFGSSQ